MPLQLSGIMEDQHLLTHQTRLEEAPLEADKHQQEEDDTAAQEEVQDWPVVDMNAYLTAVRQDEEDNHLDDVEASVVVAADTMGTGDHSGLLYHLLEDVGAQDTFACPIRLDMDHLEDNLEKLSHIVVHQPAVCRIAGEVEALDSQEDGPMEGRIHLDEDDEENLYHNHLHVEAVVEEAHAYAVDGVAVEARTLGFPRNE